MRCVSRGDLLLIGLPTVAESRSIIPSVVLSTEGISNTSNDWSQPDLVKKLLELFPQKSDWGIRTAVTSPTASARIIATLPS
jgi:hypothetical protein